MSTDTGPPARHLAGTVTERVVAAMRDDILSGSLPPGMRLKILDIAARYGVSPLPVREAISRLEGERLVELAAHRGAMVRPLTAKLLGDLYDVREALEGLMVARAAAGITQAQLRDLSARQEAWENAAVSGDAARLLDANARFHALIAAVADNGEATEAARRGWPLTVALRIRLGFRPERIAAIRAQHRDLITALAAHDVDGARAISRLHVLSARDELLDHLATAGLLTEPPVPLRRTA